MARECGGSVKGAADIKLMAAASASVQVLRDVLSQLSAADASGALQAIAKAKPVIHGTIDGLRLGLKGRPQARQRNNKFAETPWSTSGEALPGRTADFKSQGNTNEHVKFSADRSQPQ